MIKENYYKTKNSTHELYADEIKCVKKTTLSRMISNKHDESLKYPKEDTIQLTNPQYIVHNSSTTKASKLSKSTKDVPSITILKPSPKIDKWAKKVDKNEDREIDRNLLKSRMKKKVRAKLNFDEDLDSVNELLNDQTLNAEDFSLPLVRPTKPNIFHTVPTPNRQKIETPRTIKNNVQLSKKEIKLTAQEKPSKIILNQPITIEEFSELSSISKTEIIKSLFLKGIKVTLNQQIDLPVIKKLGEELGIIIETEILEKDEIFKSTDFLNFSKESLIPRPPIITIVGHADHGKTTLLNRIQKTQTTQKETGGITQKIEAYEIRFNHKNESKQLVFLDTPGHEAFSKMRMRGISITDIVVLVVAADDGIKSETTEFIKYTQSKNIPIIVAVNKIDKDESDVDAIKKELTMQSLTPEDWGGDTIVVPISATQGTNIDVLLEMIILVSEMLNLQANPNAPGQAIVLDSNIDKTRGALASVIVQNGTIHVGDTVIVNNTLAKIRGITNYLGEDVKESSPSSPALVWGLPNVPNIGDYFLAFPNEKDAKSFMYTKNIHPTNANSPTQLKEKRNFSTVESKNQIKLIVKTDTQGSSEAIFSSLNKVHNSSIRILNCSPGEVTETDVNFAHTTKSILIAFNTPSSSNVKKICKTTCVTLKDFSVISNLLEYVNSLKELATKPEQTENQIGSGVVKTVFPLAKSFVAGTSIIKGKITNSSWIHIIRNDQLIYEGHITSLKKIKEDAKEVLQGEECGIFIRDFDSWTQGDVIKAFEVSAKNKISITTHP